MTTDAHHATYREQGYLAPIRVITAAEAAAVHDRRERVRPADPPRAAMAIGTNCHLLHPALFDLALDGRVLDAVEPILGPDILVWSARRLTARASR